ncbi:MAG: hypothetical protein AAGC78_20165 [Cellvibrio sp.]|uniref:hypothetical protein n=1 Tax=Cellvibrio sp. TaxID=1965322 RepID=UPI0031A6E5F8
MNNRPKGIKLVFALVGILFLAFVAYGLATDCPNTAGYFFCSDSEQRVLRD